MNKGLRETPRSMVTNSTYRDNHDKIFSGKSKRGSYVQVETEEGWKLVHRDEAHLHRKEPVAPYVMGDIKPYKSVLDGKVISSRSHHRKHMREHGVIEVGNEKLTRPATKQYKPKGIAEDIQRSMHELSR